MSISAGKGAVALCAALVLAGCQAGTGETGRASFKSNYTVARTALEKGQFDRAARHYSDLLPASGPFEARVRLEYAHALLRSGDFASASAEARRVAQSSQGAARSAALAVQGTADQELARAAILKGQSGPDVAKRLKSAQAAFGELLNKNPELDPLGAMAVRLKTVDLELAALN